MRANESNETDNGSNWSNGSDMSLCTLRIEGLRFGNLGFQLWLY